MTGGIIQHHKLRSFDMSTMHSDQTYGFCSRKNIPTKTDDNIVNIFTPTVWAALFGTLFTFSVVFLIVYHTYRNISEKVFIRLRVSTIIINNVM